MKACAVFALSGLALLLTARTSVAQSGVPVQLGWQAPANCPQAAQVRQKLRDLLGASAGDAAPSRLRAEGKIQPIGERFRLTLNIHYDLVNGTRVVQASSCEDLGGVAAVTLALLFRAEHSSSAPLTARDLGGGSTVAGADNRSAAGEENRATDAQNRAAGEQERSPTTPTDADKLAPSEQPQASESGGSAPSSFRFTFRAPELRADVGVLPELSYGIGLAAGLRHDAWRFLASGTVWLAQNYEPGQFAGYGAQFSRVSGELSVCRGWQFARFELAPCLLLSLDDVSARGTGVGISSTNPRTAWMSIGAGFQGLWSLNRHAALVLGVNARIATSKPRFVSDSVGEISQVAPCRVGRSTRLRMDL
ncbi:MAG: hypothetical protein WDO74_07610 [Pseudomonadota bacterium]